MQTPTPTPRSPRRARTAAPVQSEKPSVVKRRQRRRKIGNAMAMLLLLGLVALLVIVSPKDAIRHAYFSIGTSDNQVTVHGNSNAAYYQGLVISEVMTSNRTAMPDEKGEYPDWIEIWNSSDRAIDMENVGLSDDPLAISFLFPKMTMQPDERIIVMCDKTNKATAGEPLHAKFGLSTNGETITLYDPDAYVIDEVKTPIMSSDESYALQPDGAFALTKDYSPGYENTQEGYLSYRTATMVVDGAVIISEICPDPLTGFRDADGELCDWVELHNTTGQTVSLKNYALSNNENKPLKWRFPEDAVIAPYGYYLVYCSGKEMEVAPGGVPHASFRISAEHDTIVLSDSRGRLVDRVTIDNIPEDASYAREEDGTFSIQEKATPTLPNTESGRSQMDVYLQALNEVGVYITEVMASNDATVTIGGEFVDWIEIHNSSAETVDLSGYGLSDNIGRARKWQFPAGTVIQPGEYRIIKCDANNAANTAAELHASYNLAQAGGYSIVLADPMGKILDKIVMPRVPTDVSYGRTMGREGFFYYDLPTPGAQNMTGFLGYADAPELTVAPGMHKQGLQVGFTLVSGADVFYTTNGAIPTRENGTLYTGQIIELNKTTVLRAKAFPADTRYHESDTVTGTYFVNVYHQVPVASLVVDPDLLWSPEYGMLADGPDIIKDIPGGYPWKGALYREIKENEGPREGYFEFYETDGTMLIGQGVDVKLGGDFSLDLPQKTFKLRAKASYGAKTFSAALFEDRPYTEYKSVNLRNAGNDGVWSRVRDGFQSRLLDAYGTTVLHQAWKPVAVYLNGIYWGHMDLRERVDRYFVAQHEGIPMEEADNMDIMVGSGDLEWGSSAGYKAMRKKIRESDPANNAADRAYIEENIDLDNFLEYMALEMFVGNSDPGNTRYYRLHGTDPETGKPYKWKWIWYDADYGFWNSAFNSPWSYTKEKGMGEQNIDNSIFRKVLEVPEWKDLFFRKLGDIMKTCTTDYMIAILDECLAELNHDEMLMHFDRWAEFHDRMYLSEWPMTPNAAVAYWEYHVNRLKNVLKKRPTLLWEMLQEHFKLSNDQMNAYFGPKPEMPADVI